MTTGQKLDHALLLMLCATVAIWAGMYGSTLGWISAAGAILIAVIHVVQLIKQDTA